MTDWLLVGYADQSHFQNKLCFADLLVQEGFYSNRTDLIRTAIRNQLTVHAEMIRFFYSQPRAGTA